MLKLKNWAIENVIHSIDVDFDAGRTYVVMGANGVGKSTLLHSIMGKPGLEISGSAEFLDVEISDMEVNERADMGMFIGFQAPTSIPGLSNFQFIKQVKELSVTDIKDNLTQFKDLSSKMKLPDDWDKRNLNTDASGGEKKKNELIQMLMMDTKLAMLDEPDSGLDVDGIKTLTEQLNNWRTKDNTLIVVTHYDKLIEGLNPDAIFVLKKDHIVGGDKSLADKIFAEGFDSV